MFVSLSARTNVKVMVSVYLLGVLLGTLVAAYV